MIHMYTLFCLSCKYCRNNGWRTMNIALWCGHISKSMNFQWSDQADFLLLNVIIIPGLVCQCTMCPIRYAYDFVLQKPPISYGFSWCIYMNIVQDCFASTGTVVPCPSVSEATLKDMGKSVCELQDTLNILNAYCGNGFHRCHACLRVGLLAIAPVPPLGMDWTQQNNNKNKNKTKTKHKLRA